MTATSNDTSPNGDPSNAPGNDHDNEDDDTSGSSLEFPWQSAPDLDFSDVAGLDEEKRRLERRILRPLSNPERYARFGVPIPNVLLSGPPGVGKTYLATALAGEVGIPWTKLTGNAIQSKYINESGTRLNRLFNEASHLGGEYGYALIFLDELDTIVPRRDSRHHAEDAKVVNEFLRLLEGCHRSDVVVIGATNRPGYLDPAVTRDGRFDCHLEIDRPDSPTRKAILAHHLSQRPHRVPEDVLVDLANATESYSGAALEQLVVDAARRAVQENADAITPSHLELALADHDPL